MCIYLHTYIYTCRGSLLHQGVVYSCRISSLVKTLLSLHITLGLPLAKRLIRPLSLSFELLKLLGLTLLSRLPSIINESLPAIMQINYHLLLTKVIHPLKDKLQTGNTAGGSSSSRSVSQPMCPAPLLPFSHNIMNASSINTHTDGYWTKNLKQIT